MSDAEEVQRLWVSVTCRETLRETRRRSTPLARRLEPPSLAASRSGWMERAPVPIIHPRRSTRRRQKHPKRSHSRQSFRFRSNCRFKVCVLNNICQEERCYLCSPTTGPFVPASRDSNKGPTSSRLLRPSRHRHTQTRTKQGSPPSQEPPICFVWGSSVHQWPPT